jgi:hypothetical protein
VVVEEARALEPEIQAWANSYEDKMLAQWKSAGGEVLRLSTADQAELMKRMAGVGEKVVKDRPALKPAYDQLLVTSRGK